MTPVEWLFLGTYFLVLVILSVYGSHRYVMAYLYYKYKGNLPVPKAQWETLPRVTVQLPIFNEMYVCERLIESVCKIAYPQDKLEIQVLDDSTDETQGIARAAVDRMRALGHDIVYLHRENRQGFKAGALQAGLAKAKGQFVAVFDADFVPSPDFLMRSVHFFTDEKIGMVQVRWDHLNRDTSHLTQAQAIFLDGHFVIEHTARNRSGRFFNFNGTAGVWRRDTIADAGGWQHDTLTEDLDLSYRAQLKGWQFIYLPEVVSPAEVPVEMNAFKSQQHRWAKGSIQTARKLLPRILKSDLPRDVKVEAFFHLTANLTYPLMILLTILMPVSMVIRFKHGWYEVLLLDLPFFWTATMSVVFFYVASQREIGVKGWNRFKYLPFIMALGIGLCVNQAKAVIEALVGYETGFTRTPKLGQNASKAAKKDAWKTRYRALATAQPLIELALGAYLTSAVWFALDKGVWFSLPFLLLFQWGFFYVGFMSLLQGRSLRFWRLFKRAETA
ncbi:MAG: glycosyltransferase family 2 protein [Deltaproteobacteria bacterium]|nr:glycosyltransferase family 2 protein [Deltaproteobacteria bacterium]